MGLISKPLGCCSPMTFVFGLFSEVFYKTAVRTRLCGIPEAIPHQSFVCYANSRDLHPQQIIHYVDKRMLIPKHWLIANSIYLCVNTCNVCMHAWASENAVPDNRTLSGALFEIDVPDNRIPSQVHCPKTLFRTIVLHSCALSENAVPDNRLMQCMLHIYNSKFYVLKLHAFMGMHISMQKHILACINDHRGRWY